MVTRLRSRRERFVLQAATLFLAVGSTLFLLLSWPTEAIDISELWWFLAWVLLLCLPVLGVRLSRSFKNAWMRRSGTFVSSVLLVPASLLFLLLCVAQVGCTKRVSLPSPSGKHRALLEFGAQGALGADFANIYVRQSWWPVAQHVFQGFGNWSPDPHNRSPEVQWLDDSHLLIQYWGDINQGGSVTCRQRAGTVEVECQNLAHQ